MPYTSAQQMVLSFCSMEISIGHSMEMTSSTTVLGPFPITVSMEMSQKLMQRWFGVKTIELIYSPARNSFDSTNGRSELTTIIIQPILPINGEESQITLMPQHQWPMVRFELNYFPLNFIENKKHILFRQEKHIFSREICIGCTTITGSDRNVAIRDEHRPSG